MSEIGIMNPRAQALFHQHLGGQVPATTNGRASRHNPGTNIGESTGTWKGTLGPHPDIIKLREYLIRIMPDKTKTLDPRSDKWDASLKSVVLVFQQLNGLTPDGKVGSGTWTKLDALIVGKPSIDEVLYQQGRYGSGSGSGSSGSGAEPEENTQSTADKLISGLGNTLSSFASGFSMTQAPQAAAAESAPPAPPPDNTLLYVGLAVGGIVVIGGLALLITRTGK